MKWINEDSPNKKKKKNITKTEAETESYFNFSKIHRMVYNTNKYLWSLNNFK